jgi:hypothetical protein
MDCAGGKHQVACLLKFLLMPKAWIKPVMFLILSKRAMVNIGGFSGSSSVP